MLASRTVLLFEAIKPVFTYQDFFSLPLGEKQVMVHSDAPTSCKIRIFVSLSGHSYCLGSDGEEVQVLVESEEPSQEEHTEEEHEHTEEPSGQKHCHFHAGVE